MTLRDSPARLISWAVEGDFHRLALSGRVANFWAGTLTIRIAYSLDGQEAPATPA